MCRVLFGLCLLLSVGTGSAWGQVLRTTLGADIDVGIQTNPYLDPVLQEWDPDANRRFIAVTPLGTMTWTSGPWQVQGYGRVRVHPTQPGSSAPQLTQGGLQVRRDLSSSWAASMQAGARRYRLDARRDAVWILPAMEWSVTSLATITVAAGLSRRGVGTGGARLRQISTYGTLAAQSWLGDRWNVTMRLYASDGQTATTGTTYGGSGVTLSARYEVMPALRATLEGTIERLTLQVGSENASGQTQVDLLGRGGLTVEWQATSQLAVFLEGQGLVGRVDVDGLRESRVATGLRFRWSTSRGRASPSAPRARVCRASDGRVQFRVPYEGAGTLYLTGDFNGWAMPGIPMTMTQSSSEHVEGGPLWMATLPLASGQYEYRVHVVSDTVSRDSDVEDSPRWLDLPPYARTAQDTFGGENGVCVVP